ERSQPARAAPPYPVGPNGRNETTTTDHPKEADVGERLHHQPDVSGLLRSLPEEGGTDGTRGGREGQGHAACRLQLESREVPSDPRTLRAARPRLPRLDGGVPERKSTE